MKTMKTTMKILCAAAAMSGGLAMTAATAMPVAPLANDSAAKIEHVRWVCGAYGHCWWRPNYYAYGARPYWRHRHWHHRHW